MRFLPILSCFCLFLLCPAVLSGQQPTWVFFADKPESVEAAGETLTDRALQRRSRLGLAIDVHDLPVHKHYRQQVAPLVDSILGQSKWLNALAVIATERSRGQLRALPFVVGVELMGEMHPTSAPTPPAPFDTGLAKYQVARLGADIMFSNGLTGKGVLVAVFDVGFPGVNTHPAFHHLHERKAIKATYDFASKDTNVYDNTGSHGTSVLSCIAGMIDDEPIGLAPGADFLLARTEYTRKEILAEEFYWLRAMEWADSLGADIINSSLGYTFKRYEPWQMDGKSTVVSRAARIAARKGILVVNAAGNDGFRKRWDIVGAPADVDSVLSIGGTDPFTDHIIYFGSRGPAANGVMKPDVSAPAQVIAADRKGYTTISGTSFSSPLVAGFAAAAWEARPHLSNMDLHAAIRESGHLYPYFDYMHGYGVPQASRFLNLQDEPQEGLIHAILPEETRHDSLAAQDSVFIELSPKGMEMINLAETPLNLYLHVEGHDERLRHCEVVAIGQAMDEAAEVFRTSVYIEAGETLRAHFEGETIEFKR